METWSVLQMGSLMKQRAAGAIVLFATVAGMSLAFAQEAAPQSRSNSVWIAELQGTVEVQFQGAGAWRLPGTNQVLQPFDRIRTGPNSRVALRWSDQSVIPFGPLTELEVLAPESPGMAHGLGLTRGIISFFHRDKPGRIRVVTRGAVAGVEGTEFVMAVDTTGRTTLSVLDGVVRLGNEQASLLLTNGQQAVADPGQAPVRTAGFIANNLLQWCFYYPAIISPDDLQLSPTERSDLAGSLDAYRSGNVPGALAKYPAGRAGISDDERVFAAALLLSVGEVDKTEELLSGINSTTGRAYQLSLALRHLIAAVKRQPGVSAAEPQTASECLAHSYFEQSRAIRTTSLETALALARRATELAPGFGFAWERVAELELGFGRHDAAMVALERGLELAPANAQAFATKGFILAARNEPRKAYEWFDCAIEADPALGNAWLGRGLMRIRLGDDAGGREDLLIAAAIEPQRSELRSYLGKAYYQAGDTDSAAKELALAKRLDPADPTAWLYSALMNQQNNRVNDAIRDLEKSQSLNDNRSVYRSGLLLDQDRAVRSADLAAIYRDAGMKDVSMWEAGRAVNADYANYSAHLFLASSYAQLRQPEQNNSRYETAAVGEFLLGNLLSPASAGTMASGMANREHFRPFEGNHLGVVSSTEYLSRGAWNQSGIQYGIFEKFSYDFEGDYLSDPGQYANNDIEQRFLSLRLKLQLTPQDGLYGQIYTYKSEKGDVRQYFDPALMASSSVRFYEEQSPTINVGYHHEWSPGVHTLLFASRVDDAFSFDGRVPAIETARFANNTPDPYELVAVRGDNSLHSDFYNHLTLYSAELQQIVVSDSHSTVLGARYQYGESSTTNLQIDPLSGASIYDIPPAQQDLPSSFNRVSLYGYHQWQVAEPLKLIGGLSYDWMEFPENLLSPPISTTEESLDQFSPKAGVIWTPTPDTTMRFAYTRSLGGQNLDQSVRIEPVQVAGFVQTFRSIIGEPTVAQTGAARHETFGLSLERKWDSGTYLGLTAESLSSKIEQTVGAFDGLWDLNDFVIPSGLRNELDYRESSLQFTANQLIGRDWSVGASYRLSHAQLDDDYPGIPDGTILQNFQPHRELQATLQTVGLFAIYNHPSGFFAKADSRWYGQDNSGYSPDQPGDSFWQFDALAGYRFRRRTAELTVGVLNLTDQDYRLNPLNAYAELPRERTLLVRFQLNF